MTKAEQIFGFNGYAGFDHVILVVEKKRNVGLNKNNYGKYKWDLLDAAMEARPTITDIDEMASIIHEILGIEYSREELDRYQETFEEKASYFED